MNLTSREKRLIIGCSILVLLTAYVFYFLNPQLRSVEILKKGITDSSQNYVLNNIYADRIRHIDADKKKLQKQLSTVRKTYPTVIRQSDILFTIFSISADSSLKITGISILDLAPVLSGNKETTGVISASIADQIATSGVASPEMVLKDPGMKAFAQDLGLLSDGSFNANAARYRDLQLNNGQGFIIPVKITATGTDEQVKIFFSRLKALPNQIIVKEYSLLTKESNLLELQALLNFYGIADSYVSANYLYQDRQIGSLVRTTSLFSVPPDSMIASPTPTEPIIEESQVMTNLLNSYDFSMRVVPYGNGMAPATVTLAARNLVNQEKSAVIYGDSPQEERVDMAIFEKDGRFYCKYRTKSESFPDKNYQETAEFKPQGRELRFIIDSTPRKYTEDHSAVNMVIANNTSLRLVITEINDDMVQPRLKITVNPGRYKFLRSSPNIN